jgi:DNA (cytosine-5)-methyltransferase 1
MSRVAVVDLFCGMGGFSCGAREAGAEVVLAIDSWSEALATHKLNHPRCAHLRMELGGDLQKTAQLILEHVPRGKRWHLHASPPCQLLSSANRMNHNPAGGMRLVYWYLDLVRACRPDSWSMEQVPAAAKYLTEAGVRCNVVDAADHGVPQSRRRCFAGEGWSLPQPLGRKVSVADVLPEVCKMATHIRGNSNSRAMYRNGQHLGNRRLSGWEGFRPITEPCVTLLGHGRRLQLYATARNGQPALVRDLTPHEYLVLQGFPRNYAFPPTLKHREIYKLIGNSLIPRIACLIIRAAAATQTPRTYSNSQPTQQRTTKTRAARPSSHRASRTRGNAMGQVGRASLVRRAERRVRNESARR